MAAPPVEGRANRELMSFLAERLGISRSSVVIVRGHTSKDKLIEVLGLSAEEVAARLSS